MQTVGVGVVGCGFVGLGAHVSSFAKIEGSRLVAIADPDEARRSKAQAKYQPQSAYADYAELVRDPEVDAVVVALPTPMHAPVALAAIEAGKHVLCEMPLAATLDQADQIIAAAESQGVILMPSLDVPLHAELRPGQAGDPRRRVRHADLAVVSRVHSRVRPGDAVAARVLDVAQWKRAAARCTRSRSGPSTCFAGCWTARSRRLMER